MPSADQRLLGDVNQNIDRITFLIECCPPLLPGGDIWIVGPRNPATRNLCQVVKNRFLYGIEKLALQGIAAEEWPVLRSGQYNAFNHFGVSDHVMSDLAGNAMSVAQFIAMFLSSMVNLTPELIENSYAVHSADEMVR